MEVSAENSYVTGNDPRVSQSPSVQLGTHFAPSRKYCSIMPLLVGSRGGSCPHPPYERLLRILVGSRVHPRLSRMISSGIDKSNFVTRQTPPSILLLLFE